MTLKDLLKMLSDYTLKTATVATPKFNYHYTELGAIATDNTVTDRIVKSISIFDDNIEIEVE